MFQILGGGGLCVGLVTTANVSEDFEYTKFVSVKKQEIMFRQFVEHYSASNALRASAFDRYQFSIPYLKNIECLCPCSDRNARKGTSVQ